MRRGPRADRRGEAGHLMAGVAAMMAIMMIFSLVAYQAWEDFLHREMEAEMVFRAQDIVRGIQRYRRANGGVAPTSWEQLMERGPQGQYFLRKQWEDPLVPDGKWGMLYIGPNGQLIDPNRNPEGNGLGGGLGGGLDSAFGGGRDRGSAFDRVPGQSPPNVNRGGRAGRDASGANRNPLGGLANSGRLGNADGETGLPIAGVRSLSDKDPFRIYRDLETYEEWVFTYLDIDQAGQPGAPGAPGQPGQPPGTAVGNASNLPQQGGMTSPVQAPRPGFGGLGAAGSAGNSAQPGGVGGNQLDFGGQPSSDGPGNSQFNQPGAVPTPSRNDNRRPNRLGDGLRLRDRGNGNGNGNNNGNRR